MRSKTSAAIALRQIASDLECHTAVVSAAKIIKENSAPDSLLCVDISVPLDYIGRSGFNTYEHLTHSAGQQIGHAIAARLDYEWKAGLSPHLVQRDLYARHETYTAKVYHFTPYQLEQLVNAAIKAGQNS